MSNIKQILDNFEQTIDNKEGNVYSIDTLVQI